MKWVVLVAVLGLGLGACGGAEPALEAEAEAVEVPAAVEAETGGDDTPDDPYGLKAAMETMEAGPELLSCAGDPECPEHVEADYFLQIATITSSIYDIEIPEGWEDAMARHHAALMEIDLGALEELSREDPGAVGRAYACLEAADQCEGTVLAERSESGEFDAYREAGREMEAFQEVVNGRMKSMLGELVDAAREAAALGSRSANAYMGTLYAGSESEGVMADMVERNDAIAVDYLIAAADGGSPEGAFFLAQMIHVGRAGPTHDVDRLLRVAYEGGVEEAGHILLRRQRERGAADPELEAGLGPALGSNVRTIYSWDVHPDKPETVEARDAALEAAYEAERLKWQEHEMGGGEDDVMLRARAIGEVEQ